ncbi:MAG: GntR family transcriptional regulator [Ruminococcaceae bacterium]|nr:GntR family transcriptional regulator [Oscillospiraceae bacterium]
MLTIDKMSRKPIYEQLVEGLEREIVTGLLKPQSQLPSIRELSAVLGVNPNTVQKALGELDGLGIIISAQGRGMFVAEDAVEKIRERMSSKITDIRELASALAKAGIDEQTVLLAVREAYRDSNS